MPVGKVSVNETIPLVAVPPLLSIVTVYEAVPAAGRLSGTLFDTDNRASVALVTVHVSQEPALDVTLFEIEVISSAKASTVTVKVTSPL